MHFIQKKNLSQRRMMAMSNKMANAMMNKDEVIKNRYNFSFFIEVVYGNINGDPETLPAV